MTGRPQIAIFGASGLIGEALCVGLIEAGYPVVPIARRFTTTQRSRFEARLESDFIALDANGLADLIGSACLVVNCVGVLQNGGGGQTKDVHIGFVDCLIEAVGQCPAPPLLVHVSIPGDAATDRTEFAVTKRHAEAALSGSSLDHVILRPGFVLAPAAFGGNALLRAMASLPLDMPDDLRDRSFMFTAVQDITATVVQLAERRRQASHRFQETWDVMSSEPETVGSTLDALRQRIGGPRFRLTMPTWVVQAGARVGDLAAYLGWRPPLRSTAVQELRRGVAGDPFPWMVATGIRPTSLAGALRLLPATVQEKWFSRLYLIKALAIGVLAVFWAVSGLIALTVAFDAAAAILVEARFSPGMATAITAVTSLMDIGIGLAIAFRRTCGPGLIAGTGVALCYMFGAAILTPDMWIEPLGALVKTGPAIVLMLVLLAMLEER